MASGSRLLKLPTVLVNLMLGRFRQELGARKARVTLCDLLDEFFCIHVRPLCEFQKDESHISQ